MAGVDTQSPLPIPRESDQLRALIEMRWRLFTRAMLNDSVKINFALWLTGRIVILCFAVFVAGISAFLAYIG